MPAVREWRGDDDGSPPVKFGRKAQAWLGRRITAALFTSGDDPEFPFVDADGEAWAQSAVDLLLDWYVAHPKRYAKWVDSDEYRGRGYSHGAWEFSVQAVAADWRQAVDTVDAALDANKHSTLEDWLTADLADDLWYRGAPGGMAAVAPELRARVHEAKRERERKAKRTCPCGASFAPARRNARRCPGCLARARTEQVPVTSAGSHTRGLV